MFSNSTSMQLIYVESLTFLLAKMANLTSLEARTKGNVIVLLYTIFVNFLRWSIGYNIMKPEVKVEFHEFEISPLYDEKTSIGSKSSSKSTTPVKNNEKLSLKIVENKEPLNTNAKEKSCFKIIKEGINMPFIAGIGAIAISSIPYLKELTHPSNIFYKLFIGNKIYFIIYRIE